jgi:hypothetical protein
MEYFAPDRRQEREDTSLVISLKLDLLTNATVVDDATGLYLKKLRRVVRKKDQIYGASQCSRPLTSFFFFR